MNKHISDEEIYTEYFCLKDGFGKHKETAISLLKQTVDILDEYKLDYFLISGTLLGYVRHNDFIPWDDDIDIIVDSKIFDILPLIVEKYKNKLNFITKDNYIVKTCFLDKDIRVDSFWKEHSINQKGKYHWPFVDMFVFSIDDETNTIKFFNKDWDKNKFFPLDKVSFLGINVTIPSDPDHFLSKNYKSDYMTVLKSNNFDHKKEKIRRQQNMSIDVYNRIKKIYDDKLV